MLVCSLEREHLCNSRLKYIDTITITITITILFSGMVYEIKEFQ